MAHGDEGSLNATAGGTALSLARKTGMSIVCGHTHRLGIQHQHMGYAGKTNHRLFGVEVGNMMDMKKAKYLPAGTGNWQQGFAVLSITKSGLVIPHLVPIINKSFLVDGVLYQW